MQRCLTGGCRLRRLLPAALLSLLLGGCQLVGPGGEEPHHPEADPRPVVNTARPRHVPTPQATLHRPVASPVTQVPEPVTDLWERLRGGFALSAHYQHPGVSAALRDYAEDPALYSLIGERAQPFLFTIISELEARGMPLELALLPVVESTFDPDARSREGAVGLWQFVGDTARRFGLQQDWWYDGRRDVPAATQAALDYLTLLNERFEGDWLLTLAAYNAGGGNVSRAIRRSGQSEAGTVDFWTLPLARETLSHVPRLLALARVVSNPEQYGIELPALPNSNPLARVEVGAQVDLLEAARLADMPYEALRALNTGYRQWATHPDQPQHLYLPHDRAAVFENRLTTVDLQPLVSWHHYAIQPGDSLGAIAQRFHTRVDVLQQVNGLVGTRIIAGQSLLIPRGEVIAAGNPPPVQTETPPSQPAPPVYRVRRGDSLWSIARRFNLRSSEIARHNGIALDSLLMPGQLLNLGFTTASANELTAPPQSPLYQVRPGDTLGTVARRLGIGLAELLDWNQLTRSDLIYPGQQLQVRPPTLNTSHD